MGDVLAIIDDGPCIGRPAFDGAFDDEDPARASRRLCEPDRPGSGAWRRAVDRRPQPFGLTEALWLPLIHLGRALVPMRQKDLAASLVLAGRIIRRAPAGCVGKAGGDTAGADHSRYRRFQADAHSGHRRDAAAATDADATVRAQAKADPLQ